MRWTGQLLLMGAVAMGWSAACDDAGRSVGTGGGGGGEGGCEPGPPAALYTVTIRADEGPLPPDTTVQVRWSAGDEPSFVLDDPTTHKSLEEGSNLVCEVPSMAAPSSLRCELWTSGATEVEVTAAGYDDVLETLTPEVPEGCDEPVPSETELVLVQTMDPNGD